MHVDSKKNEFYALAIGGVLILIVGGYFMGKYLFSDDSGEARIFSQDASIDDRDGLLDIPMIDPKTLNQKIMNGDPIRIVDVRSPEEYQSEHLRDSISLSLASLEGFSVEKEEIAVVIFSEQDDESLETIKNIFSKKSFPYFFLRGGFAAWKAAGNPTVSIGDPRSFSDQAKIMYISPSELKDRIKASPESVFLIDVQSQDDYEKAHIRGAMNIPLDQIEKRINTSRFPIATTIVVYGANDVASFQAGVRISDSGALSVLTLSGNNNLAPSSGLPIEGRP